MAEPPDNKVARPEASMRGEFGDATRSGDLGSGQAELFNSSACLPTSINVGPFGISEWWLVSVLQLPLEELRAMHGEQLGSPRDYGFRRDEYFYTAAGIRRILEARGLGARVAVVEHQVPPAPPRPTIAPGAQRPAITHPHKTCPGRQGGFIHRAAASLEAKETR